MYKVNFKIKYIFSLKIRYIAVENFVAITSAIFFKKHPHHRKTRGVTIHDIAVVRLQHHIREVNNYFVYLIV